MYTVRVKLNATEFRRNLFQTLDKAGQGEPVEINYKGQDFQLVVRQSGSKLARAVRRHALLVDPDSIIGTDKELMAEFEAEWEKEWKEFDL